MLTRVVTEEFVLARLVQSFLGEKKQRFFETTYDKCFDILKPNLA